MKLRILLCAFSAWSFASSLHAQVTSFDDIQLWAGTGTNRAALVIQWNDGGTPTSLAWGFRWSGTATGMDMLTAISGLTTFSGYPTTNPPSITGFDSRLRVGLNYSSFGDYVRSIEFVSGSVTRSQADWDTGFWEYFCVGGTFDTSPDGLPNAFAGSPNYPGTASVPAWNSSWTGAGTRVLSDGSWDAWSFAANFVSVDVAQPLAAVPEPSSALLIAVGGFLFFLLRAKLANREMVG